MKTRSIVIVGILSMLAAGVVDASDRVASETGQIGAMNRIGQGGSVYSSGQPDGAGTCHGTEERRTKVDALARIGAGGSTYDSRSSARAEAGGAKCAASEEVAHSSDQPKDVTNH